MKKITITVNECDIRRLIWIGNGILFKIPLKTINIKKLNKAIENFKEAVVFAKINSEKVLDKALREK